jgi:hypothetical protein
MACDATAMFKTPAELAKGAMGALKNLDLKALAGQDQKSILAKLPPGIAAMIPAGLDLAAVKANPAAYSSKIPPVLLAMIVG